MQVLKGVICAYNRKLTTLPATTTIISVGSIMGFGDMFS